MSHMRRIMIMGPPGSGKSTLAVELGKRLNLTVVHLDSLFWNPGWVETPQAVMEQKTREIAAAERWVIDGNYTNYIEPRFARADAVIYLDFGRWHSLWRVAKRWLHYRGQTRPDLGEGCPEKLDREFITFIWNYPKKKTVAELGGD